MVKLTIEHGIPVNNSMTAIITGHYFPRIGDRLSYPNGKIVTVTGIGNKNATTDNHEVLLSGDVDTSQRTVVSIQ